MIVIFLVGVRRKILEIKPWVAPSALLIGEQGLNPVPFGMQVTRFLGRFHIRDQVNRFFVSVSRLNYAPVFEPCPILAVVVPGGVDG